MPHADDLRRRWSADPHQTKIYSVKVGSTVITLTAPSDGEATDSLVRHLSHLRPSHPFTREAFEEIGGTSFTCDGREIFLPSIVSG
jgi:hypothetical protein